MADNAITKLPLAGQLGVSLLVAALIGGGFYYLWYSDALEQEKTKQARLEQLKKEIRALEVTANKLQEFQREVQLLEAKLETLKRILPPEKETPDLMRRVQYLASQSSLLIKDFTPAPVATKEFYLEVPINVGVEGTYHNLGAFFDRVSRLSRLINVGNIKVKAQTNQTVSNTITATAVATTYVYVDAPPSPPPGAPGAPGTPARR
jgi:type IV pilus assembly protein PilO